MRQNNSTAKITAIFLSVLIILLMTYSTVVSSMYITHELEHHKGHQEGHCLICLEIQLAGHLTKQLATAGNQVVPAVLMIVTAGFFSTTLPCYRLERNLITDKVRMDR